MKEIILASGSPRRQELLKLIVPRFTIQVSDIDESIGANVLPQKAAEQLAFKKARSVWENNREALVIGADTMVALNGEIMGKPKNREQASEMLKKLSGAAHTVYTGMAIVTEEKTCSFISETQVVFAALTKQEIADYIYTNEPYDKAGGYGIQGQAAAFVKEIHGNYLNVVGLDIAMLKQKLQEEFSSWVNFE